MAKLTPECNYGSPLLVISTASSPENGFCEPQKLQENAGKSQEIQGFLLKSIGMPRKRPIRGIPEIHSGDPKWAFWGDFPWQMRMANLICWAQGNYGNVNICSHGSCCPGHHAIGIVLPEVYSLEDFMHKEICIAYSFMCIGQTKYFR